MDCRYYAWLKEASNITANTQSNNLASSTVSSTSSVVAPTGVTSSYEIFLMMAHDVQVLEDLIPTSLLLSAYDVISHTRRSRVSADMEDSPIADGEDTLRCILREAYYDTTLPGKHIQDSCWVLLKDTVVNSCMGQYA